MSPRSTSIHCTILKPKINRNGTHFKSSQWVDLLRGNQQGTAQTIVNERQCPYLVEENFFEALFDEKTWSKHGYSDVWFYGEVRKGHMFRTCVPSVTSATLFRWLNKRRWRPHIRKQEVKRVFFLGHVIAVNQNRKELSRIPLQFPSTAQLPNNSPRTTSLSRHTRYELFCL